MAELTRVEINNSVENENISLEEQAKQQEAKAAGKSQAAEATDRPEWLDEKFSSPEELAKAYKELQSKLGSSGDNTDEQEDTVEEVKQTEATPIQSAIASASEDFEKNGELSAASFKALEKAGIPKEYVEAYMEGIKTQIQSESSKIQESVGGAEAYQEMTEWALDNLSEGEIEAFNSIVEKGTIEQAKVAVKGLYARYVSEGSGSSPKLLQGGTRGTGVAPFTSAAQVTAAMRDPRYDKDASYRQEVQQRMAVSSNPFG